MFLQLPYSWYVLRIHTYGVYVCSAHTHMCFTHITVILLLHVCNDSYCFTHTTVIGLSHVLQWILILYTYYTGYSDWMTAFVAMTSMALCTLYSEWIIAVFAMDSIALLILQWLGCRSFCIEFYYFTHICCFTHIAAVRLSHFCNEFHCFTHSTVLGFIAFFAMRSIAVLYTHYSDWIIAFL